MMGEKKATIYDIAKEAEVSVSTVSRVLTGNANVKKEKRERVEELIRQYDYRPNALAKGLRETRRRTIGIVTVDIRNPFFSTLVAECEREARQKGYTVIIGNTFENLESEKQYLDEMCGQQVDAIIILGGQADRLETNLEYADHVNKIANRIPVITTGTIIGADYYQVSIDETRSIELVIDYLIKLGHRDIAMVGGNNSIRPTADKRLKYRQLLRRNGIEICEDYIQDGDRYDAQSGYQCMERLFALNKIPTAVIAINDFNAMGISRSIREHNLAIPEDISLVSFDNTFIAEEGSPRLTSVSYDYECFGKKLIQIAIAAAEEKEVPRVTLISPTLIIRDSCMGRSDKNGK